MNSSVNESPEKPSTLRIWLAEMRAPFLTGAIVPVILGTCVAWATTGVFFLDIFLLTLIAGVFIHIGSNIANDYYDHKSGTDDTNVDFVRPFTGGSRMIQRGWMSPREVFVEAIIFFALGGGIGIYLTYTRGIEVLILGIIGIGSGFFYTAPPFRFVSRGYGEVFIGLNFGVLMTLGAYFVQTQVLAWEAVFPSIPVAILITAVLYINEFPDHDADRDAGKRTIVVRLGRQRAAKGYAVLMASLYLSMLIPILLNLVSWYTILGIATLPIAVLATRNALVHYDHPLPLTPAYASTVANHLFTGLFLAWSYVMIGLGREPICVFVWGILCLAISSGFYIFTEKKAKAATPHQD
ncbi:1,4-dihydroxy-2-naphthoate octaprenyltransferase [Candidatus Thorarchaeota archaeon]|nr:MAG: 1,4-dihydroxy-2-naphthoate octaprenyltransferase [Candidatus Thorarchaeota archaeon]